MKKGIIFLAVILILAAITKPSENSFNNYVKSKLEIKNNDKFLDMMAKGALQIQSNLLTQYEDKIFFSYGKTSLANTNPEFIGVFGFWFQIN